MSKTNSDQPSYEIHTLELGPMDNFIHLISDKATGRAAFVDPAWEVEEMYKLVEQKGLTITDIILTHCHNDHSNRVEAVQKKTNAQIHLSQAEYEFWKKDYPNPNLLHEGDIIKLGNTDIEVLFTPGHTAGSICFKMGNDLIVGDTLFVYGCGHCKLPGADPEVLFESLQRLKTLPDDIVIHSGHNYGITETSTMKEQREGNPFLHFENKKKFVEYREVIHDQIRTYPMEAIPRDS
ncbi:MAG: MBL fold metallo-hydrolase [Gammaproteobacteria bacterium]|nr:MBL fold metallo-hydrolase [Gammaproteobacteria bacterium]